MRKMKTDPIQGIMNYYWRMIQFQTYLETTWAAMEAIESTSKTVLFDLKLRENLAGAIFLLDQMAKLVENKHNIWTKPYNKLILKLDYYKRALKSLLNATKAMESKRAPASVHMRVSTKLD